MTEFAAAFRHRIPVRYGEVDQQGVVFNAHYLAYIDDTFERWTQSFGFDPDALGWDMMLKTCTLTWHGPAHNRETVEIGAAITRWGRTSFEIGYEARVGERLVLTASVLYVSVVLGENTAMETPAEIRAAFGPAVAPPA